MTVIADRSMNPRALARSSCGGQRVQVGQGVGHHDAGHPLGPVQPGQGVGVLDQPGCAAQRAPQLVHHAQVGAARGDAAGRRARRRRRPCRTRSPRCTASRRSVACRLPAPTRLMSTTPRVRPGRSGRVVGPSNTPAREPVHSRSRVKIRSAARSWNAAGVSVRAAARTVSGPFSRTPRTSAMVGCAAGDCVRPAGRWPGRG